MKQFVCDLGDGADLIALWHLVYLMQNVVPGLHFVDI